MEIDQTDEVVVAITSAVQDMTTASDKLESARHLLERERYGQTDQGAVLLHRLEELRSEMAGMAFALGQATVDLSRRRTMKRLGKRLSDG